MLRSSLLEALAYPHGVDRYVELVRPLLSRDVRAEVTAVRRQTPKSVTLTLRAERALARVSRWSVRRCERRDRRGPPHPSLLTGRFRARPDGELELTVSTHPEGRVSRYLYEHARPGMIIGLTQAQGEFVLGEERSERVLLISGGSGITPVMAMLRTLCDEGFAGEVGFLNYARSPQDALYERELRELARRNRRPDGRTRFHPFARVAARRALQTRAPARGHLRALRRRARSCAARRR